MFTLDDNGNIVKFNWNDSRTKESEELATKRFNRAKNSKANELFKELGFSTTYTWNGAYVPLTYSKIVDGEIYGAHTDINVELDLTHDGYKVYATDYEDSEGLLEAEIDGDYPCNVSPKLHLAISRMLEDLEEIPI